MRAISVDSLDPFAGGLSLDFAHFVEAFPLRTLIVEPLTEYETSPTLRCREQPRARMTEGRRPPKIKLSHCPAAVEHHQVRTVFLAIPPVKETLLTWCLH